jgi:hypothetical protein
MTAVSRQRSRANWISPTWSPPPPPARHRKPCRICGQPMDPAITDPPPAGCGQDMHPLCDIRSACWADAYAAALRAARTLRGAA